jgi:hypothetical protein
MCLFVPVPLRLLGKAVSIPVTNHPSTSKNLGAVEFQKFLAAVR